METWIEIPGFPRYKVSDLGRVIGPFGRVIKPSKGQYYFTFKVPKPDGGQRNMYVHHAVALAFIGERPDGLEVCHLDGNPLNNWLNNLRYDTPKANNGDKVRHGTAMRGERVNGAKLREDQVREIRRRANAGDRTSVLAREFGVGSPIVSQIKHGTRWGHL